MWRKPVGEGAKRVTTGVVILERRSRSGRRGFAPVQGMAMSVTAFIANGPLSPSLTCGDRGPYSKIGPLLVLRVWANSHWSLFGKVDPVGVIALPGLDPGMTGQSSIPSRRLLDRPVNPRIKSEEGDDSAVAGNLIE